MRVRVRVRARHRHPSANACPSRLRCPRLHTADGDAGSGPAPGRGKGQRPRLADSSQSEPRRQVLTWVPGLRKEQRRPRSPRDGSRVRLSFCFRRSTWTQACHPVIPGPSQTQASPPPGELAFTHKAAIACVPLGSPSCTLCHCPTTTLGGRSEYTAAL